jgi:transposase
MAKKAKQYTTAFRAQAVRLCEESGRPIADVAKDLDVTYQTLYGWMKKAGKTKRSSDGPSSSKTQPKETLEQEVRRLRRELDEANLERAFLKKAAAFFAKLNK